MQRIKKCNCGSVITALFTRIVFALHALIAFWRIATGLSGMWSHYYWFLLAGLVGLFIETVVTLYVRKGAEYKWVCPSVFFYLASIVPCVWILELDMLEQRLEARDEFESGAEKLQNETQVERQAAGLNFTLLNKIRVPIEMEPAQWVVMIEQLVLFVLILGRWMLPKGDISRDELSQLLLVYIGMAADIIEFFEAFKEEKVKYNWDLIIIIMAIWSASLLQFCLVLTATKSKKGRAGFHHKNKGEPEVPLDEEDDSGCCECCACCGTEVFGIMTTVILQDGPFLALRMVLLFRYDVNSYMHIFFTVKNTLVLLLMFYRLYVVYETRKDSPSRRESMKSDYINIDNDARSIEGHVQ